VQHRRSAFLFAGKPVGKKKGGISAALSVMDQQIAY
jgi:hypothetical protein